MNLMEWRMVVYFVLPYEGPQLDVKSHPSHCSTVNVPSDYMALRRHAFSEGHVAPALHWIGLDGL